MLLLAQARLTFKIASTLAYAIHKQRRKNIIQPQIFQQLNLFWRKPDLLLKSILNFKSSLPFFSSPLSPMSRYR